MSVFEPPIWHSITKTNVATYCKILEASVGHCRHYNKYDRLGCFTGLTHLECIWYLWVYSMIVHVNFLVNPSVTSHTRALSLPHSFCLEDQHDEKDIKRQRTLSRTTSHNGRGAGLITRHSHKEPPQHPAATNGTKRLRLKQIQLRVWLKSSQANPGRTLLFHATKRKISIWPHNLCGGQRQSSARAIMSKA